ncbi:MAG: transposase [Actinobacteria bacterium]|nr:transposase [Actinomycetota bacterium]
MLTGVLWQDRVAGRLARAEQTARVRIARDELRRVRELTRSIDALYRELAVLVKQLAPQLLTEPGCGVLIAAKLIGEIAGIGRFATDAKLARIAGAAPIPASSGRTVRLRLDRGGNREINCALHRLAVIKGRNDPTTAAYLARKQAEGKSRREALRCLKRHLARRVWQLLQPVRAPHPALALQPPNASVTIHCNTPHGRFSLTYRDENPWRRAAAILSGGVLSVAGSGALGLGGRTQTGQAAFCSLGREPVDIAGRPCD